MSPEITTKATVLMKSMTLQNGFWRQSLGFMMKTVECGIPWDKKRAVGIFDGSGRLNTLTEHLAR